MNLPVTILAGETLVATCALSSLGALASGGAGANGADDDASARSTGDVMEVDEFAATQQSGVKEAQAEKVEGPDAGPDAMLDEGVDEEEGLFDDDEGPDESIPHGGGGDSSEEFGLEDTDSSSSDHR